MKPSSGNPTKRSSPAPARAAGPARRGRVGKTNGPPEAEPKVATATGAASHEADEHRGLLELQPEQLREAQVELELTRQRYADMNDLASMGYVTFDASGCIREINQTAALMLGASASSLIGNPLVRHVAAADREDFLKLHWQCRQRGDRLVRTLTLAGGDGGVRRVQFVVSPAHHAGALEQWCHATLLDVTEQVDAQDALSASETMFRLLAENIGDVFWFLELDPLRLTYVSPAFERIWGHAVEDVLTNHVVWQKAIHADDSPAVCRAFRDWVEGTVPSYQAEYRIVGRGGRIRWIADRGIVLHRGEGRAPQLCGIARDITASKLAEETLTEKAGEMQAIVQGTADGILIADAETRRFTFGNTAICRMLGATPAELRTMGMEMIHPKELVPGIKEQFDAMARGELTVVRDVPLQRRDGTVMHVDISGSVVVINGRRCNLGVFHDVTALRRAEAKFKALLEAAPDAMMIHGRDGRIEIINGQTEKLFGYARHELIGRSMEMLMPERFRHRHVQHRDSYTPDSKPRPMGTGMVLFALHKDGREIPVEISLSNMGSDGLTMVISSIRDITLRQKAEDELRQSRRLALSTLEAVPANLAVLDESGVILSTNEPWNTLAGVAGGSVHGCGPGGNYLASCDVAAAQGDEVAARLAVGIRDVLGGRTPRFIMEFPCQLPAGQRWYVGHVTPFSGEGPRRVVIAHLDITKRKRAERVVHRLNEELELRVEERTTQLRRANETLQEEMTARRRLEEEILEISERERQRIGQDLHDDLGQQLAGAWCLSQVLENDLKARSSPVATSASRITETLQNALALTRNLARGLHPVALEAGGLMVALKELAARTSDIFQVECRFGCAVPVLSFDNTVSTHLYRIAQESVTNAVKHGRARHIEIGLEATSEATILSIVDDGVGISQPGSPGEGMGLRIMRYRADMIGGQLAIGLHSAGGTIVTCTIPAATSLIPTQHDHGQKSDNPKGAQKVQDPHRGRSPRLPGRNRKGGRPGG